MIDSTSHAVVWSWDSTAFGLGNPTGSVTFNLRFPGQYYDVGSNQFYNHNRFYNPELGRYMEPDPIGLEGGLNPYAYAGSNPVMNVDPSGLSFSMMGPMNDFALSNSYGSPGLDLSNLSINYVTDKFMTYQNNYNNLSNLQVYSSPTVVRVLPFSAGAAAADGPFPFGDAAALVVIGGAASYDLYQHWTNPAILNENGEPASEQTAKDIGRRVGKDLGRDAQRDFHDLKEPGAPDRTLDQLKSDAEELYEKHGKPIPEWLKR